LFEKNFATVGSAIYVDAVSLKLNNSTFRYNVESPPVLCENVTMISNNLSVYENDWGFYVSKGGYIEIINSSFTNNKTFGLEIDADTAIIRNSVFSGNGNRGIDFSVDYIYMDSCKVTYNKAEEDAGIKGYLMIENGNSIISNSLIAYNEATKKNGGFKLAFIDFANNIVVGNKAPQYGAGSMFHGEITDKSYFTNNSIIGNVATDSFSVVEIFGKGMIIKNNIIWDNNSPESMALECYKSVYYPNEPEPVFENNIIQGTVDNIYTNYPNFGTNNMFVNPQMADTNSFYLSASSPAIDAADTSGMGHIYTATDILGNPRFANGVADIGAIEYFMPSYSVEKQKSLDNYNVDEDFNSFTFSYDSLFTYKNGEEWLNIIVTADTNVVNASIEDKQISISSKANAFGTDTIIISASDGFTTASDTSIIIVNSVNDKPAFVSANDTTLPENSPAGQLITNLLASNVEPDLCFMEK
jgi:hypothetical protein